MNCLTKSLDSVESINAACTHRLRFTRRRRSSLVLTPAWLTGSLVPYILQVISRPERCCIDRLKAPQFVDTVDIHSSLVFEYDRHRASPSTHRARWNLPINFQRVIL